MARYINNQPMKYLLCALSFLIPVLLSAQPDTPEGRWKTIDDETGEAKSIVEIFAKRGKYYGKIAEIISGNAQALCEECGGAKKNKPILGLEIIEDLVASEDDPYTWEDGTILDPRKGASYGLTAWFDEGEPDVLYIRGRHWTGLYRTQKWIRE